MSDKKVLVLGGNFAELTACAQREARAPGPRCRSPEVLGSVLVREGGSVRLTEIHGCVL